jgi:hypothetical protein
MRILGVLTGEYGERHLSNIRQHAPEGWTIEEWRAPTRFPIVIDYPDEYVPTDLPAADLILSFQEVSAVAELLPDVVKRRSTTRRGCRAAWPGSCAVGWRRWTSCARRPSRSAR